MKYELGAQWRGDTQWAKWRRNTGDPDWDQHLSSVIEPAQPQDEPKRQEIIIEPEESPLLRQERVDATTVLCRAATASQAVVIYG